MEVLVIEGEVLCESSSMGCANVMRNGLGVLQLLVCGGGMALFVGREDLFWC